MRDRGDSGLYRLGSAVFRAQDAATEITNNAPRMRYDQYRAKDYLIGSGTVESSCKQIVTQRLKCSGAQWIIPGAVDTAKARAAWLSEAGPADRGGRLAARDLTIFACTRHASLDLSQSKTESFTRPNNWLTIPMSWRRHRTFDQALKSLVADRADRGVLRSRGDRRLHRLRDGARRRPLPTRSARRATTARRSESVGIVSLADFLQRHLKQIADHDALTDVQIPERIDMHPAGITQVFIRTARELRPGICRAFMLSFSAARPRYITPDLLSGS